MLLKSSSKQDHCNVVWGCFHKKEQCFHMTEGALHKACATLKPEPVKDSGNCQRPVFSLGVSSMVYLNILCI